MPEKKPEVASKHFAITPSMFDRFREFSRGLGGTYDDAIAILLDAALQPGEDALLAGKRLRDQLHEKKEKAG